MKRVHILTGILAFVLMSALFSVRNEMEAQSPPVPTRLLSVGTTSTTLNSNTQLLAAANTGLRYYISEASCVNVSASTVSAAIIKDGTTSIWVIPCPAAGTAQNMTVFNPPLRMPTAATAVNFAGTAAATTLYFNARAYVDR